MSDLKYGIEKYRLKHSVIEGFEVTEDEKKRTVITAVQTNSMNGIFVMPVDGGENGSEWGRLHFEATCDAQTAYYVFVAASDVYHDYQEMTLHQCRKLMEDMHAVRYSNTDDILLYDLYGRYLYIAIEAVCDEEICCTIRNMSVDKIGDVFMDTFPRIYRERNSFFHRFLSVFSSVYTDLEDEIDALPELLDVSICPKELLTEYGKWLGIDLDESFLSEDVLRAFVQEAYQLNKMKGTRYCLERICEILLGEKGIIVERNQLSDFLSPEQLKKYDKIYGDSKYDVTLLLMRNLPQTKRSQLEYILEQFLPLRCSLHIVELNQVGGLDGHTYLDVNATVFNPQDAQLDHIGSLDQNIILA